MPGPQRGFGFFTVRILLEQKGSRSPLHNRLRPIHFINPEGIRGCQPLQVTQAVSLQNCNVWQDKFFGMPVFLCCRAWPPEELAPARRLSFPPRRSGHDWLAPDVGLSICPTRFYRDTVKPSKHDGAAAKTRSPQPCRRQEIRAASPASINRGRGV